MSKERPILFSAPMVRALLDGTKTQTRRIMKIQPTPVPDGPGYYWWPCDKFQSMVRVSTVQDPEAHGMAADASPYGRHGDRLWVKETHSFVPDDEEVAGCAAVLYAADGRRYGKLRPSIHMPRWASRILLEIVSVRVERLQDISERDAVAEGIGIVQDRLKSDSVYGLYYCDMPDGKMHYSDSAYDLYKQLWDQINGAGSRDTNPFVWAIEFNRVAMTVQTAATV